jgi:hypothetical protein
MPKRINIGDGATALPLNTLLRRGEGYGWLDGGGVTLGASTTGIDVDAAAGTIRADGSRVEFGQQTVTLPDGHPQYPRRDLVYVDYLGTLTFLQGVAREPRYSAARRFQNPIPAPPDSAAIDGVPLMEVWVPAGATETADLDPSQDFNDARVADVGGLGIVPVRSADPAEEILTQTRLWRNDSAGEFRAYAADAGAIVSFSTSTVQSFSGPANTLVEGFESDITGNWAKGGTDYTYTTPAFEGSAAASWDDSALERAYSLPGDGLPYYPEPGDTIAQAVRFDTGATYPQEYATVGFGKEIDEFDGDYRVELSLVDDALGVIKTSATGNYDYLGSTSVTLSEDTWYIIEADYDGGGTGVHPTRVWSTTTASDPGQRDSILAEIASPTADETWRGRGVSIRTDGRVRIDYLHAQT